MIESLVASIGVIGTLLLGFSLLCVVACGSALLVAHIFFGDNNE